jgi:hypothetical protein
MVTHSEEAIVLVDDQEFVIPGTLKKEEMGFRCGTDPHPCMVLRC